jgi:hypothetical protein
VSGEPLRRAADRIGADHARSRIRQIIRQIDVAYFGTDATRAGNDVHRDPPRSSEAQSLALRIHDNRRFDAAFGTYNRIDNEWRGTSIMSELRACFEQGWIEGGRCSLQLRRPVYLPQLCVAKGVVARREVEGSAVRLYCDVWIENERGEKVITGAASGLIACPARSASAPK